MKISPPPVTKMSDVQPHMHGSVCTWLRPTRFISDDIGGTVYFFYIDISLFSMLHKDYHFFMVIA